MSTSDRDEALASLASTDWSGAVAGPPKKSSIVHSVRLPHDVAEQLAAEATRRGVDEPSALIRQFIVEGLARRAGRDVTEAALRRVAENLHRAIDDAVRVA